MHNGSRIVIGPFFIGVGDRRLRKELARCAERPRVLARGACRALRPSSDLRRVGGAGGTEHQLGEHRALGEGSQYRTLGTGEAQAAVTSSIDGAVPRELRSAGSVMPRGLRRSTSPSLRRLCAALPLWPQALKPQQTV